MKKRIYSRNLPQLFLKARERLMSHFRPILQHFGLTEQQWRIMRVLDEHVQLEPREICDLCQMLSSSMAGMLARMEDMGLVTRERMEQDQRRVLVCLAPHGKKLMREVAHLIDLQYRHIEQSLGKPMLNDLLHSLENFIGADQEMVTRVKLP